MRADSKNEKAMRAYIKIGITCATELSSLPKCLTVLIPPKCPTASHLSFVVAFSVNRDHNCH